MDGVPPLSIGSGLLALVAAVIGVALFVPTARIRAVAQIVSGAVCVVAGLLAAALVVGAFVLEKQGGGVMLLFAVVPGVIAWVAGGMFSASRRYSALRRLPVDEQQRQTLADYETTFEGGLARLARLRAERDRFSTSAARRAELDRTIAHEQGLLGLLPLLKPALDDVRTYEQERPRASDDRR